MRKAAGVPQSCPPFVLDVGLMKRLKSEYKLDCRAGSMKMYVSKEMIGPVGIYEQELVKFSVVVLGC